MQLTVGGLRGGHSGIDIHRHRANANKLLARTLHALTRAGDLRLATFSGGTKRNAIPRNAAAVVACRPEAVDTLRRQTAQCAAEYRCEFPSEPALDLRLTDASVADPAPAAMTPEDAALLVNLLLALPHGVAQMAPDFADLVLTSSNLAIVAAAEDRMTITTSQRSLSRNGLDAMSDQVRAAAALAGARTHTDSDYLPGPRTRLAAAGPLPRHLPRPLPPGAGGAGHPCRDRVRHHRQAYPAWT